MSSPAANLAQPIELFVGHIDVVRSEVGAEIRVLATTELKPGLPTVGRILEDNARRFPERVFLQERDGEGWKTLTYAEVERQARQLGQALLARGVSSERPLAILSANSIDHALLALGAMYAGIPVAPISVAYSHLEDLSKIRTLLEMLTPALVYADDATLFSRAFDLARELGIPALASRNPGEGQAVELLDALLNDRSGDPGPTVGDGVAPSSIAKILFTSGSTGFPKGVIITHAMMLSSQDGIAQVFRFLEDEPPVIVDWLPWSHVAGGCWIFACALRNAGTLVIDDGKPVGAHFQRSLRNLREIRPTLYFGVPKALGELVRSIDQEPALAAEIFDRLRAVVFAGAALPQGVWDRLREIYAKLKGQELPLLTSWGTTETTGSVTHTFPGAQRPGSVGLPLPGVEIKLVPNQNKLELRVRGPSVTPGYWRRQDLTDKAFDADGFYITGDAGSLDEHWLRDGILFDGRVAENFKLSSGTWVNVGQMRLDSVTAGAPVIEDVVVAGHDQNEVGLLVFPSLSACRDLTGQPELAFEDAADHPLVRKAVAHALSTLSSRAGSSFQARRAVILKSPASLEAGEITDKGYLNQRAILENRADQVKNLYAEPRSPIVVVAG